MTYKPYSVKEINKLAKSAGWKGRPIPDKFTPEQKIERADRYNRLHEKLLRIAADRHFKKEQATNIFVDWQKNAGVKDIKTGTTTRYAENEIFDFSGTEEAAQKNAEIMTMIDAFGLYIDTKTMQVTYDKNSLRYGNPLFGQQ